MADVPDRVERIFDLVTVHGETDYSVSERRWLGDPTLDPHPAYPQGHPQGPRWSIRANFLRDGHHPDSLPMEPRCEIEAVFWSIDEFGNRVEHSKLQLYSKDWAEAPFFERDGRYLLTITRVPDGTITPPVPVPEPAPEPAPAPTA